MEKNTGTFKKTLLVIDIIVLLGFGYLMYSWINNHKNTTPEPTIIDEPVSYTAKYKSFTYMLPPNVGFEGIDNKKFKFMGNNWYANVEIFIDSNDTIYEYSEAYYNILLGNNPNVGKPNVITINNVQVVCYEVSDKKMVMCYFKSMVEPYAYEVEIFNDDESYNTEPLKTIIDILYAATYDENDKNDYAYDAIDIEKLKKYQ